MTKLPVLALTLFLLAGCAVVTPYGGGIYAPVPEIAVAPYPCPSYPFSYYPFYPYSWYAWGPGCCAYGYSYRSYGYHGPPGRYYRP